MAKKEDKLERIESKLDKVVEDIGKINVTTAKQQVSLDEHIRRTNLLEDDIKPIKKHVAMIQGALKFIGLVCVLAGAIESVLYVINFFIH